ncbi:MAG: triple tyrosine motif-containing protein, partial [Flavisolibacter sp.]
TRLQQLFALAVIEQNKGWYLEDGYMEAVKTKAIRKMVNQLCWDIRQDAVGRMYFANNEGLLTYDGSSWKLYYQPNKSILRSIALDKNRIYAGGQDELGFFSPNTQGILQYTSLKSLIPKQYSNFTDVWEIEVFKQSVFFRTSERIFEYNNDAISVYPSEGGWHIMKKAGNKLLAQDQAKGLFQYINNKWEALTLPSDINFEITGIVSLENDSLLLSSIESGLYIYHNGQVRKKNTSADKSFIKNHIYCFEQINNTEFVVGTTSEGFLMINSNGEVVQQISRSEGLQNNNVLSIFLDKDHNLWAGLDNGISFIAYNSAIKYIKPGKPDELAGYSARVFDNKLYVATSDGAYFTPLNERSRDLSFSKGDFIKLKNSSGQAWKLDEVNHRLLMGHHTGSFLIDKSQAVKITGEDGAWTFIPTSSVFPAKNLLVGTYNGLEMLEYENNHFNNLGPIKGLSESLRFLAIDNGNIVWASHPYRGVYKISLDAVGLSYNYELFTQANGLPSTLRNNVFRIKNRVVFATEKGIYEFNSATQKFERSPLLFNVLGNIRIQYLTEDADGNIWFCSEKNIGVVNFENNKSLPTLTYFPELTGKILSGFENIYPYNKENIFIASTIGIIHLNYKKYLTGNIKPDILLAQVKMSGKSDSLIFGGYFQRGFDSSGGPGNNNILYFPSSNNSFHFEFSSPVFGLQSNIRYSYQLKGYDRGWSTASSKSEKEYTNLPDGNYTFVVKAYDNLGNESEEVSYSFVIEPAWYKTVWAYLLYIALFVAIIYFIYTWQRKKFIRQQLSFEEEQKRL